MQVIASKEYMYHGTSSTFLRAILKKGLVFDPKKRIWDEVKDSHLESFNGIYFAHNLMTAYSSASTAVDKFGGQRLIIIAKLETRSSQMVLDEDGLTLMIQGMVARHHATVALELLLSDIQKNYDDEHWITFKKKFKEKIKTIPKNVNALFPLFKKMLHSYHLYYVLQIEKKGYYDSYEEKKKLVELKEKFNDITFLQAKKNYRKIMDKFLKKASFLSNAKENERYSHAVRITEPVNFKGKNRIVAIVSFLDYHTIKIHYNKDQSAIKALKDQAKMNLSGYIVEAVVNKAIAREVPELYDWANELSRIKAKEFVQRFGKSVGKGSSRMVYKQGKFIIKRAMNQLGIEQNEKQEEVWRMNFQDSRKMLAPVYAISDDGRVLIMGYAKPFRSFSKATKRKIGIAEKELSDHRRSLTSAEVLSGEKWEFLGNWNWGPNNLASFYLKGGGKGFGGDFVRPSSWGVMGNRIVLTDYGF